MSNLSVTTFQFSNNPVRTVTQDNQPWFVAVDICNALELSNSRKALQSLDDDEKGVTIGNTLGGNQKLQIVNESGMYHLVFRSRKPNAKAFRRWVTGDVLPALRKTGTYTMPSDPTLTPASQRTIQEQIASLAHENKAYAKYYGALKTHFRVGTYKDIPESKLAEALQVLDAVVVKPKAIEGGSEEDLLMCMNAAAALQGKIIVDRAHFLKMAAAGKNAFVIFDMMEKMKDKYMESVEAIEGSLMLDVTDNHLN